MNEVENILERVKAWANAGKISADEILDRFPELKESEDERIRKALLNEFIHLQSNGYKFAGLEGEEIIAYLEKQKEQPMELLEPDKNVEKIIEDVIRVYGKTQGEWVGGYDIDTLIVNLRRAFEQKEQKPLSTEETELNSTAFLEQLGYTCIPPRAEQRPAEWSEEDERKLELIISDLRELCNWETDEELISDYEDRIAWLESLRTQPHWKPSEGQMAMLKAVLKDNNNMKSTAANFALNSLYNDLEKLI